MKFLYNTTNDNSPENLAVAAAHYEYDDAGREYIDQLSERGSFEEARSADDYWRATARALSDALADKWPTR